MAAFGGRDGARRRGCCCCGGSVFPEESFRSWPAYGRSLLETGPRLRDRVTARSLDSAEVNEVRGRSGAEMKRTLTWWDLIWFGIGAGIFVLTGQEAAAPPSSSPTPSPASPPCSPSSATPSSPSRSPSQVYTQTYTNRSNKSHSFIPVETDLRVELGDFMAFIAADNVLLEYCIGGAVVDVLLRFATLLNHHPNDFRIHAASLSDDYSRLDHIAVTIVAAICLSTVFSTKGSFRFKYILSIVGLTRANLTADFGPFGARGIFAASAVLFFAYIGFDAVSTIAVRGRERNRQPPREPGSGSLPPGDGDDEAEDAAARRSRHGLGGGGAGRVGGLDWWRD